MLSYPQTSEIRCFFFLISFVLRKRITPLQRRTKHEHKTKKSFKIRPLSFPHGAGSVRERGASASGLTSGGMKRQAMIGSIFCACIFAAAEGEKWS